MKYAITFAIFVLLNASLAFGLGNETIQSFSKAKKQLHKAVYHDTKKTIYCGAQYDEKKAVTPPVGFVSTTHKKRAKKIEWEHIVPAENFGRTFKEWREGHPECVTKKGKAFKGRSCASKMNTEYRYMQADMYNLFPAIGSVNAKRSNYNFVAKIDKDNSFGSCAIKIYNKKVEPPVEARGRIARTYLYMETTYPRYKMSKAQKRLMETWDKQYPVSQWECTRAARIKAIQKNENSIMTARCSQP